VGKPGKSCASYYVKNTDEVLKFLSLVVKLNKPRSKTGY
jgi:hypothetical protein